MTENTTSYRGRVKYNETQSRKYQTRKPHKHQAEMRLIDRAIQLFDHRRADLVICDIRMPGMSGIATIQQLRERDPKLPIIVVTGFLGPDILEQCAELGGIDLVRKPFVFQELSNAVESALQRARASG